RTFTAFVAPIEDGGTVAILHDVSRFKDLDQVKNEFIATASHDLKNPLTSIGGFAQLLLQAGPLNENQKEFVDRIQHSVKSMSELIQNMMALAQADLNATQKHEPVDIKEVLDEVVNEFAPQARGKEQNLEFTSPTSHVQVNGDSLHLRQAFRNLLGNAIKYTPKGGLIQVQSVIEQGNLLVHFKDNGYGIPATDLPFIFNRFYRVRTGKASEVEGNGLGLAIVKAITVEHNGSVNVESQAGKGSCFSITLPLLNNNFA
ncbi:MAG TPA: HAMP domain-containing sensor histidine kinase, partial [Anaerolineales bacterium]|nr:HAMP domain-containing sensor histidine kinase [Anaerolineales bacterium]